MKVIVLKSYLETTIVFLHFVFFFGGQNFITNLVLKRYFRLLMGRKNVKVCKIKKNKTIALPSETCFRYVSKQNKKRFRSQNIHSKIVSKTSQQTVTDIKKLF